jgi:prophage regulatory protein
MLVKTKAKLLSSAKEAPRQSDATAPAKNNKILAERGESPRASDDAAPATKGKAKWADARGPPDLDYVIRKPQIERYVGLRLSVIHDMIAKGKFPRPMRLNPDGRAVGWLSSEIEAWQKSRKEERDSVPVESEDA